MSTIKFWTLGLALVSLAAGCGDSKDKGSASGAAAAEKKVLVCPPCGMELAADSELREMGGMKFAVCNDACAEKVAAEPAKYAAYAVP